MPCLIGVALSGTSSVLYGTVPELAPADRRARAFAIFYTCTTGAGAIAPWLYGWIGDGIGLTATLALVSVAVLLVLALSLPLRPILRRLDLRKVAGSESPAYLRRLLTWIGMASGPANSLATADAGIQASL
jgi:predicted MFS family arabinose efflux permease